MRAVVQRVNQASVSVDSKEIGKIDRGLLVFLGIGKYDEARDLDFLVDKILGLRIFNDEDGKMNLSLRDIGGELLVVSQFTLYGDVTNGKRPNFFQSASPDKAEKMYEEFIDKCRQEDMVVETGEFGADMKVGLVNDGPVTIILDSDKKFKKER